MKPSDFVKKYYKDSLESEKNTKVPALFTLAQAALETGWGEHTPGNMFFGIKDVDGINDNEQLLTTTEYSRNPNLKFPVIISKVYDPLKRLYKYIVKDYFRKYKTPEESFTDHAKLFIKVPRYQNNFVICGSDPICFAKEVALDGYATDPNYFDKLEKIINTLKKYIPNEKV